MQKLFTLCFMLAALGVYAQDAPAPEKKTRPGGQQLTVNWGTKYRNDKKEHITDIIYDDGTYIYATATTTERQPIISVSMQRRVTPALIKFDEQMMPVKRRDYTADSKDAFYHGTYFLGGKFIMLTSFFDKRANKRELFVQKFDTDLEPDGKSVMIWKIEGPKGENMKYNFDFSQDSSKFFVSVDPGQKRDENKQFAYKTFDKDLNPVYEKNVEFSQTSEEFTIKKTILGNSNDLYVLCKIYSGKGKKEKVRSESGEKIAGYEIMIKRYSPDGTEKEYKVDMNGRFLENFYMTADRNGNLQLFACYEEELNKGINGFVYLTIDSKTGAVISNSDYKIPAELASRIDDIQDDKPKSKQPAINNYFSITDLKTLEDGSAFAVLEKNYSIYTKMSTTAYTTYYSDGMIVLKIDTVGKVKWCKYIPKRQFYNDITNYISHSTMLYKDNLYLFYDDSDDNEGYDIESASKPPKKFNEIKKMNLMMVKVDKGGRLKRSVFGNTDKMGTNTDINLTKQLTPKRMVICGLRYTSVILRETETKLGVINFE